MVRRRTLRQNQHNCSMQQGQPSRIAASLPSWPVQFCPQGIPRAVGWQEKLPNSLSKSAACMQQIHIFVTYTLLVVLSTDTVYNGVDGHVQYKFIYRSHMFYEFVLSDPSMTSHRDRVFQALLVVSEFMSRGLLPVRGVASLDPHPATFFHSDASAMLAFSSRRDPSMLPRCSSSATLASLGSEVLSLGRSEPDGENRTRKSEPAKRADVGETDSAGAGNEADHLHTVP